MRQSETNNSLIHDLISQIYKTSSVHQPTDDNRNKQQEILKFTEMLMNH